jgi:RHS repeat-associated protein
VTQVEYAYDQLPAVASLRSGQRIWRETKPASPEGATVTWFLYSREGLIGEYRADGSAIREYGWLPNGLWGTDPVWQHDATGTHVMHNDHLFTPERMTKAGQSTVSWAGTREAFGRVAVQPGSSTTMLLRFPGQWEDGVGGFYQNWWREYGAGVGRYRSADPIGVRGGINSFVYVYSGPMDEFDLAGLYSMCRACDIDPVPSPIKEVALTCFAETELPKLCADAGRDAEAMVATVYNKLQTRNKYFARDWCSGPGKTPVDVVSYVNKEGVKQYLGFNSPKYTRGLDSSALEKDECDHLALCIEKAYIGEALGASQPVPYHNFNQTNKPGRTQICKHFYRVKIDVDNRNDF